MKTEVIISEQSKADGIIIGRGNTRGSHNPFSFSIDTNDGYKTNIRFDGYATVTADKSDVKKALLSHFVKTK